MEQLVAKENQMPQGIEAKGAWQFKEATRVLFSPHLCFHILDTFDTKIQVHIPV